MKKVLLDNKAVNVEDTKVTFGAFNSPTPTWAKNAFGIIFVLTSVIVTWVAATNLVSESWKFETMLIIKSIDALAFGLMKAFGLKEDKS